MALLTATTHGINLESFFLSAEYCLPLSSFRTADRSCSFISVPPSILLLLSSKVSPFRIQVGTFLSADPTQNTPRFLCVVIGTSSLHRPTWLGGSRATCSHFFTVFLLTHHSLSFEKAKQGGQVGRGNPRQVWLMSREASLTWLHY